MWGTEGSNLAYVFGANIFYRYVTNSLNMKYYALKLVFMEDAIFCISSRTYSLVSYTVE
jgi:hypothetical protein